MSEKYLFNSTKEEDEEEKIGKKCGETQTFDHHLVNEYVLQMMGVCNSNGKLKFHCR